MTTVLWQYGYYLRREWEEQRTYKTAVALGLVSTIVALAQFAFLGMYLKTGGELPGMERYGGSIIAYLISGTAFTGFVAVALHGFTQSIQAEQSAGTLEAVATSPAGLVRVMLFSASTALLGTTLGSAVMLALFSLVLDFPVDLDLASLLYAVAITMICLGGFGMAGCGVILVTKKGDPITWIIVTAMTLFSGVLYPISILPTSLQYVSHALPTTTSLELVRRSLLAQEGLTATVVASWPVLLWAAISVPVGFGVLRWGLRATRERGSLAQF